MTRLRERIVFLPGFLCDERVWGEQVRALRAHYDCHVVDFKGLQGVDAFVEAVRAAASSSVHVVGFSMGGYIAQAFAARYPERVLSLTLVAVNVGELSERERRSRLMFEKTLEKTEFRGLSPSVAARFLHPDHADQWMGLILSMSEGYNSRTYIDQMRSTLDREDWSGAIQQASYPVAVVAGAEDQVVPVETLRAFHQGIHRSHFHEWSPCGHYVPLEQSDRMTELLKEFLK